MQDDGDQIKSQDDLINFDCRYFGSANFMLPKIGNR
jgi:hypothetical protein